MPYISTNDRESIEEALPHFETSGGFSLRVEDIGDILKSIPSGKIKGAFNYFVTKLWFATFCPAGYTDMSDALAVFNDMDHEIRRRTMNPYEDVCIQNNGDLEEFESFAKDSLKVSDLTKDELLALVNRLVSLK
jgi:hypothetical protein